MFGIPIDGATRVFCDNDGVVKNTTRPESALKKKCNAICYHKARESIAGGWVKITKENGRTNVADLFTKLLPGPHLRTLSSYCMWK